MKLLIIVWLSYPRKTGILKIGTVCRDGFLPTPGSGGFSGRIERWTEIEIYRKVVQIQTNQSWHKQNLTR